MILLKKKIVKAQDRKRGGRRKTIRRSFAPSPTQAEAAGSIPIPSPLARAKYNASINPQFNPSINPKSNASLNPKFNPWLNPERNTRISPKFNQSLNPLVTPFLNPTCNPLLDPKQTLRFSGLCRLSPDSDLVGYVVRTSNKAVLLLFDKELNWTAYAVDNGCEGYNLFDVEGNWKGYVLKNQAGGLNEFNLEGDWTGFITGR